jgi:Tfp pilus assembly protein PilF
MLVAGDVAASEDVLHAAVTLNPQSVYPWVALAQLACAKQKVGEARLLADRFLELATGVNASLPSLAAGLAAAFAKAGDTVYAEALQRRASA